jgi:DNA modification methylase
MAVTNVSGCLTKAPTAEKEPETKNGWLMHVITTSQELADTVAALEKSDFVTVDTEFIRETTFWPGFA